MWNTDLLSVGLVGELELMLKDVRKGFAVTIAVPGDHVI
jgi:hypothetical protein